VLCVRLPGEEEEGYDFHRRLDALLGQGYARALRYAPVPERELRGFFI
jgi:hypothetical protein